jgi:eukaryotic-like serine/threonine-protein kinase
MEEVRAQGSRFTLKQAVGIIVPLSVELADRHAAGEALFVHPSSVVVDDLGHYHIDPELARSMPSLPRDKACLAPEQRGGSPGLAHASVFSVGAILYELVTGLAVGPGMRRPSEVVLTLPPDLELVLSKALVADVVHRPDDLGALAQAVHNMAPSGSIPPPPADESHLDHADGLDVDVSMSMMPPAPLDYGASSPYDMVVRALPAEPEAPISDSTNELSALKARLEGDPRPRYIVIKDGMDHGPFSAVELLQQIATHHFVDADYLRDVFSKDERAIKDWEEFAPFAEHARLHRDIKAEKEAIERVVAEERKSTASKTLIGVSAVGALLLVGLVWFLAHRGARSDEIAVQGETATNIETDAGLKVKGRHHHGGVVGSQNGIPILSGGMSCESAVARYNEEINIGGPKGPADITAGQYGAVLNRGSYFSHCGAPSSMAISICAAVQNGRAVGVTVVTNPRNGRVAGCVAASVRGLHFPSNPRLDVTHTSFAAQ